MSSSSDRCHPLSRPNGLCHDASASYIYRALSPSSLLFPHYTQHTYQPLLKHTKMRFTSLTHLARPTALRAAPSSLPLRARTLHSTSLLRTQAGYGDPQDEKIENRTPKSQTKTDQHGHEVASGTGKPSSAADPHPDGQGKGMGSTGGTTDPEIKPLEQNANEDKKHSGQEIKETKKVGQDPKKEEVGGEFILSLSLRACTKKWGRRGGRGGERGRGAVASRGSANRPGAGVIGG